MMMKNSVIWSIITVCSITKVTWCLPGSRYMNPRDTPAPNTASTGPITGTSPGNIIVTTTFSSSTYTLTYIPPTTIGTIPVSASTTDGWHLVPPIVPLPFPAPPVVPPPEEPGIPEEPENPGDDNDHENEPNTLENRPTLSIPECSTSTATLGLVNCTQIIWVSSYKLQSSLSGCSTTSSTTSGCALTITNSVSTATVIPDLQQVFTTSGPDIYAPGPVIDDLPNPPDDPYRVVNIFAKQLNIVAPVDPPKGSLTCAAPNQSGPSFSWYNANVGIFLIVDRY